MEGSIQVKRYLIKSYYLDKFIRLNKILHSDFLLESYKIKKAIKLYVAIEKLSKHINSIGTNFESSKIKNKLKGEIK
jgi:hypothetical protein